MEYVREVVDKLACAVACVRLRGVTDDTRMQRELGATVRTHGRPTSCAVFSSSEAFSCKPVVIM